MMLRWEAPDAATARSILSDSPRAAGWLRSTLGPIDATHFRDVYFDSREGELRERGGRCRIRFTAAGDRCLTLWLPDGTRVDELVRTADDLATLTGSSSAAARLRALVDPSRLIPWIERSVERARRTYRAPLGLIPVCDLIVGTIALRRGGAPWGRAPVMLRGR